MLSLFQLASSSSLGSTHFAIVIFLVSLTLLRRIDYAALLIKSWVHPIRQTVWTYMCTYTGKHWYYTLVYMYKQVHIQLELVYTYLCKHRYMYMHEYTHIHRWKWVYIGIHRYTWVHMGVHRCTWVNLYMGTHGFKHACTWQVHIQVNSGIHCLFRASQVIIHSARTFMSLTVFQTITSNFYFSGIVTTWGEQSSSNSWTVFDNFTLARLLLSSVSRPLMNRRNSKVLKLQPFNSFQRGKYSVTSHFEILWLTVDAMAHPQPLFVCFSEGGHDSLSKSSHKSM